MLKNLLTQASSSRSGSRAPKEKFSLENLKYLYSQLVKYPVVDASNAARIVEVLRSIAELMIWGDQHNPLFFDYFAEKNVIANFAKILRQPAADTKVKTQVIQTLSILISNTDSEQAVFYLLSNNYINDLIVTKFDFNDEELLANYISFLKSLSFKLNNRTILFFFNDKANDFPLYVEALKFYSHQETMVRIAVRTLSLNIYKVDDTRMRRFIIDRTCLPYFSNLVWTLKDHTLALSKLIETTPANAVSKLEEFVENMIDFMLYMQDVLSLQIDKMSGILLDQLMSHYIFPVLVGSLVARYDPEKRKQAAVDQAKAAAAASSQPPLSSAGKGQMLLASPPQRDNSIQARLALFMLSQIFQCFNHSGLVNSVAIALLHPRPATICETLVRNPIKYPFRHPKLSLASIIFPKSAQSVTPAINHARNQSSSSAAPESNQMLDLLNHADTTSISTETTFSSSSPKESNHETDIEPFSPSNNNPSSVESVADEHAALFDMFSGKAPSTPQNHPPVVKEVEPVVVMSPSSSASTKPTSPTATKTTRIAAPSAPASLSQSGSATSLSNFRRTINKSASSLTTFITGSKNIGVGSVDAPLSVVASTDGRVYVLDSGHNRVCVFDRSGAQVRAFGKKGHGDGEMMECEGIAIHPNEPILYITDHNNHRVSVYDLNGQFIKKFGVEGSEPGEFQHPTGIAVSAGTGLLYVVDSWNHRVQVFDSNLQYLRSIGGKKGDADGELSEPAHVSVCQSPLDPTADRVYITDYGNDRVQVFDQHGKFLLKFGSTGKERGEFIGPVGLTIANELVYVVDRGSHRIQVFDLQGSPVRQFGKRGNGSGELHEPNGVSVGPDGRLYVADTKNNRIVVYMTSSNVTSSAQSESSQAQSDSTSSTQGNDDNTNKNDTPVQALDVNLRARSSLPEMKVVYNPEKSCPNYSQPASQNRSKQAVMFALGSQDERVGFGAMGLLYSISKNEAMDPDVLIACGLSNQEIRKSSRFRNSGVNGFEQMSLHDVTVTSHEEDGDDSNEEDNDESSDEESTDEESDNQSNKTVAKVNADQAAPTALDFFSSVASPRSPSPRMPNDAPSTTSATTATLDLLAAFDPTSSSRSPSPQPAIRTPTLDVTNNTETPQSNTSNMLTFDYSAEIVSRLVGFLKPRVPPVRLTTSQLAVELLKELVLHSSPDHPSLNESHFNILRDANRAVVDDLKLKFKIAPLGNFILDVLDDEFTSISQTVFPRALASSPRNLLPIDDRQLPGLSLEWRRSSNEFEAARKLLQTYFLVRSLRYFLVKKKDPFFPLLLTNQSTVKVGDEFSLASAVLVPCVASHSPNPMLLCIDTDVLILIAKAEGKASGKVECIMQLALQEPYAVRGNPAALNLTYRAGLRPHSAARRIKSGPGVAVPLVADASISATGTAATVPLIPNADNKPLALLSGQKPIWNLQLVFGDSNAANSVRKTLESARLRLRKAMMNKVYISFEQRYEETTTSINRLASSNGTPAQPPIVPFSILNLLGDRQAEIVEEET